MYKRVVLGLCVVVCVVSPAAVQAEEIKSVDQLIEKLIEARGGRKAINAAKTMRLTGKNVMAGGSMEMPMTIALKAPDKMRLDLTFQGMAMTQAFDGSTGWRVMPFGGDTTPQKMSAEEADLFKREANIEGPLIDYKKKGYKVELLGMKETDGSEMYEIKLTYKDGTSEHHFLDAEYFLTMKKTGTKKMQGMEMEFSTNYGDYKEVSGLMIAHAIASSAKDNPMANSTLTFQKIEVNAVIPDSFFVMPEIKAPVAAAKPTAPDTTNKASAADKP